MPRARRPQSRAAQLHADWIGMLQPDGLVVSVAVLEELDLYVAQPLEVQQRLRAATEGERLPDLSTLLHDILGWKPQRFVPAAALVPPVSLDLLDLGVSLAPTGAGVSTQGERRLLVQWIDGALDATPEGDRWPATHTERFERLLSRCGPPVGLLASPTAVRLCFAPSNEAPGRLTWPVAALRTADGRLLVDALHMLLGSERVFGSSPERGLGAVLRASRERQEQVTEQLAAQVEEALRVLLAGWDEANQRTGGGRPPRRMGASARDSRRSEPQSSCTPRRSVEMACTWSMSAMHTSKNSSCAQPSTDRHRVTRSATSTCCAIAATTRDAPPARRCLPLARRLPGRLAHALSAALRVGPQCPQGAGLVDLHRPTVLNEVTVQLRKGCPPRSSRQQWGDSIRSNAKR